MRMIRSLFIAFSTYSRIPVPQVEWLEENRKYSMCFFPLIGAVIGWLTLVCLLAAALCVIYYRHMAYKQFGGVTGDLAGWFLQVTELVLTAVIVLGGKL